MVNPNILKRIVAGKYPPIDMGIAVYHLKIAAEHFGGKVTFLFDEESNTPPNTEYVISLKIEK
jgi:hypothetical protein